jgi:hypothetical protein
VSRTRTSLDGEWEFYPDPKQGLTHQTLPQEQARSIQVPGPWQAQFDDLRDYSGVAWYRLRFEFPDAAERRNGGTAVGESSKDLPPYRLTALPPTCNRCGFPLPGQTWGCKNPCLNCGTLYPLGDCSD